MKTSTSILIFAAISLCTIANAYSFQPGDELWTRRTLGKIVYHHAGVYIGNNQVVHANATPATAAKRFLAGNCMVKIEKTSLSKFTEGHSVKLGPTRLGYTRAEVVKRTLAKVGDSFSWNPVSKNCQHFSSKMVSGNARSPEASQFKKAVEEFGKNALKKAKNIVTGKNDTQGKVKNCAKKKAYICIYNGGDLARIAAKKKQSVAPGQTANISCAGNGKSRCQLRLSTSSSCSVSLTTYNLGKNQLRYVNLSGNKLKLSSSCR